MFYEKDFTGTDIHAGDTVYLKKYSLFGTAMRTPLADLTDEFLSGMIQEGTVEKAGHKYAHIVSNGTTYRIRKDTGIEESDYSPDFVMYKNKENAIRDLRKHFLFNAIKKAMEPMGKTTPAPSLNELETIAGALGLSVPWEKSENLASFPALVCMHTHGFGCDAAVVALKDEASAAATAERIKKAIIDFEPEKCENFDWDITTLVADINSARKPGERELEFRAKLFEESED